MLKLNGCTPNQINSLAGGWSNRQKGNIMYKMWALVIQNMDTKKVKMDTFMGRTENEARWAFYAAYPSRDGKFRILSAVEVPEGVED